MANGALVCLMLLVIAATVWLVAQALSTIFVVTVGLVSSLLLAALLRPFAGVLARWGVPAGLGALTALVVFVGVLGVGLFFVVRRATQQLNDLQLALTQAVDNLRQFLISAPLSLSTQRVDQLRDRVIEFVQHALPSPSAGATMVLQALTAAAIALFVLFFLLKDGPSMWRWAVSWTPHGRRERFDQAGRLAWTTLTSYVRGVVTVALIDSVLIGAAMFVMGVPLALSLSMLIFVGAFVPFVGATVSGALAVVVTLVTVGPLQAVILLGVVLLVQFIEGNILGPLIYGHAVHLHPVVILVAISIGGILAGILGAIIAVPLVAMSYQVAAYLAGRRRADPGTAPE